MRAPAPTIGPARPRLAGLVLAALTLTACGSPPPAPSTAPTVNRTPQDVSGTPDPSASVLGCEWFGPAGRYDPAF